MEKINRSIITNFAIIYSNLYPLALVDTLLFHNYNRRNSRLVLASLLSYSFRIHKKSHRRLSAWFLLSDVRSTGK